MHDNVKKSFGLRNGKKIYEGYNEERKVENRKAKVQARLGYEYYKKAFNKDNNLLPQEYKNIIVTGDSLQILQKLPDNCIDIVVTSPPYNFGLEYNKHDDTNKWHEYYDMLFGIFDECIRVVKYGGRIIINVQPLFSDYIPSHHIISNFFFTNGLIWKGEILWEKKQL